MTRAGRDRFNALARSIGLGGQFAVVVDGVVAAAPRLDERKFSGKGRVTAWTRLLLDGSPSASTARTRS